MNTYTLKELSQELGISQNRLVPKWREMQPIKGKIIYMDEIDGDKCWWLVPVDQHEAGEIVVDGQTYTPEEIEAGLHLTKKGSPELTLDWLTNIEGIGKKGGQDILDEGYTTFAELQALPKITDLPGIGKVNGENLKAALVEELGEPDLTEMRASLFENIARQLGDNDAATDIAHGRVNDGTHDHQLTDPTCNLDTVAKAAAEYAVSQTVKERMDGADIEIRCPHCDGLYDHAPVGVYESNFAECEAGEYNSRGDCGERFWLDATATGYTTHKRMPAGTMTGKAEPDQTAKASRPSETDEQLAADGGETASVYEDCDTCGVTLSGPHMHRGGRPLCMECADREGDEEEAAAEQPEPTPKKKKRSPFGRRPSSPKTGKRKSPFGRGRKKRKRKEALVPADERVHPALTDCRFFGKAEHGTDAWHKLRAQGIGSSDASAILGLSPHATAKDVWATKIGEETDNKPWLAEYADFGTWMEPHIRRWCEEQHGIEIVDGAELGALQSARYERALANIDGLDVTGGVVEEYKTTTEKWPEIPAHYEAQCMEQMLVTGVREVRLRQFVCPVDRKLVPSLLAEMEKLDPSSAGQTLADWLLEHGQIHTWIVERNEKYIDRMVARFKKFWASVEMGIEPIEAEPEGTVDLTDEAEVYAACNEYVRLNSKLESEVAEFLAAEGLEVSSRGSVGGTADKAIKGAKKKVRKAIEKAVALMCDDDERPKRVSIGDHHATYIDKGTHAYWRIYTKGADDVVDV